jgi:hypothetical protein
LCEMEDKKMRKEEEELKKLIGSVQLKCIMP